MTGTGGNLPEDKKGGKDMASKTTCVSPAEGRKGKFHGLGRRELNGVTSPHGLAGETKGRFGWNFHL